MHKKAKRLKKLLNDALFLIEKEEVLRSEMEDILISLYPGKSFVVGYLAGDGYGLFIDGSEAAVPLDSFLDRFSGSHIPALPDEDEYGL